MRYKITDKFIFESSGANEFLKQYKFGNSAVPLGRTSKAGETLSIPK